MSTITPISNQIQTPSFQGADKIAKKLKETKFIPLKTDDIIFNRYDNLSEKDKEILRKANERFALGYLRAVAEDASKKYLANYAAKNGYKK